MTTPVHQNLQNTPIKTITAAMLPKNNPKLLLYSKHRLLQVIFFFSIITFLVPSSSLTVTLSSRCYSLIIVLAFDRSSSLSYPLSSSTSICNLSSSSFFLGSSRVNMHKRPGIIANRPQTTNASRHPIRVMIFKVRNLTGSPS